MSEPFVAFSPGMKFGRATVNNTQLSVEAVADLVYAGEAVGAVAHEYAITQADVLVACWYMGTHGTRTWRKRWAVWARDAEYELWRGQYEVPDPPSREVADA